jgi:hypothetical protein
MIKINQTVREEKIKKAYLEAQSQIIKLADDGQENFMIYMELPNLNDGYTVFELLEKEGVKIHERGFNSSKNLNGSYSFSVSCYIAN